MLRFVTESFSCWTLTASVGAVPAETLARTRVVPVDALALMFNEIHPGSTVEALPDVIFDMSADAMLGGSTLYLWGFAALPVLHAVMWIESKLIRGAR